MSAAKHTAGPLSDAAALERIAGAVIFPHAEALCAIAERTRQRADATQELLEALRRAKSVLESFGCPVDVSITSAIAKATGSAA